MPSQRVGQKEILKLGYLVGTSAPLFGSLG